MMTREESTTVADVGGVLYQVLKENTDPETGEFISFTAVDIDGIVQDIVSDGYMVVYENCKIEDFKN